VRTQASSRIGETSFQNLKIRFLQRQYGHYAITPLRHYAITPVRPLRHYASMAITPLRHYASTAITPLCQYIHYVHYASTPVRQYGHYAITLVRPLRHYASTSITSITAIMPLHQYASTAITPLCQYVHYSHYAITPVRQYSHYAITPVWPLCHSPHSLASVKDMYVDMGFTLNLYQHYLLKLYSKHWTDTRLKQEKCAYRPMILDRRYSNVGLAKPLVNISPSCSEVSIFKSLIPYLLISSQNQIVLVA
jgi:muconolactone delta-isomerase